MAKIHINNLGAIHSVSMEIKQFNLFIGEQATGKSTLCKAVYYFRNFKEILLEHLYDIILGGKKEHKFPKALNSKMKDEFIKLFGYSWELPDNLYICYEYSKQCTLEVRLVKQKKKYLSEEIQALERLAVNCHSMLSGEDVMSPHVIELKGKNIDQAFGQLEGTIRALDEGADTRMLVNGRKLSIKDRKILTSSRAPVEFGG